MPTASFVTRALAACLLAASAAGCSSTLPHCVAAPPAPDLPPEPPWLLIESQSGATYGLPPEIEVRGTPVYAEKRLALRTVAIRLPDSCKNDTASQASGKATQSDTIVQTNCGVYLSELERALVSAGFRVMSWDAVSQSGGSSYEAAQKMGADAVFVFNSLDVSEINAGSTSAVAHRYYHSDANGNKGAPFPLDESVRAGLRKYAEDVLGVGQLSPEQAAMKAKIEELRAAGVPVGDIQQPKGPVDALSATLDSTAILTGTGEAMWFYRFTATKPVRDQQGKKFLFQMQSNRWFPAEPRAQQAVATPLVPVNTASAEDVQQGSVAAGHRDQYARERLALIRAAATDFVERFRSGNLQGGAR